MQSPTPGRYAQLLYDDVFKIVFAAPENEDLLIMLLNLLIPEIDAREITFIDKEQHGFAFNEKKCIFDVYIRTASGERVVVEMQYKSEADFLDRVLFYATYPIREQLVSRFRSIQDTLRRWIRRKSREKALSYRLKPVYVVSILNFALRHDAGTVLEDGLVSRYELRERSSGEVMTDALHFVFLELGRMNFGADHPERYRTILEKLAFSLKYIASLRRRPDEMLEEIFKRLFDAAELAAMDAQTRKKVDKAMTTKIDILQGIQNSYADGYEAGEKSGMEKGRDITLKLMAERMRKRGLSEDEIQSILQDEQIPHLLLHPAPDLGLTRNHSEIEA